MGDKILEVVAKEQWDKLYKHEDTPMPVQRDISQVAGFFREYNVSRILDLACGSGRHTIYLAKQGFELYGIDISEEGIKSTRRWLENEGLHAELTVGSIYERLPYKNNFFDAVVCIRALNHGTIENIREAISEIERVLKPEGLVYVTLRKRISKEQRLPHKDIAPRTYVPLEGKERGVVHYLFTKEPLRREFGNFKMHDLRVDYGPKGWEAYYILLGELKSR